MRLRSWLFRFRSVLPYRRQLWLFLLPYLLGTLALIVLPALFTLVIAFTEYHAIRPPTWVGLDNFRRLLDSYLVRLVLRNTMVFVLLAVPLRLLGALLLALLLQRRRRLFGMYRAAVYLPTIIPEAAYALIWLWILNPVSGPLNIVLRALGLPAPAWLAQSTSAQLAMIIMAVFQLGEGFVVVLAGLQSIPRSFYELATVDGASGWQCFWKITMPLLTPWLLLLTLRDLIVSLQNTFTPSFMLTYGGPEYATTFAPLAIYELSFDMFNLGEASAFLVLAYGLIGLLAFGILNLVGGETIVPDDL
jgi:multiple sugar transport system permease protein